MNTNQGALYFGAGIDLTQWRRDIDSMRRDIAGFTRDTIRQTQNVDSAFKSLSLGIAGYFSIGALKNFVMEMVNVRGEFQKTEIAFTTMLGNAGKANALMGDMVELAAKTPFSLQDVSAGAKQLLAFQVPANEVVDTLTRMGNIAAGLSIPLSRINLVYGQVRAKGKLMGDDLRQFTEAGIPMVAELAKKFNKTTAEVSAMVSAGKIGFNDVKDVLFSLTNEGGMFFNLMEKQSKSVTGQIANMGDAWDQALNRIGESQEGLINDTIGGLTYLIEHYEDVIKVILTLVETYGAYRAALIVTNVLQGRMVAPAIIQGFANLIKLIRGATVAQTALNAASLANPYVLVATLIVGLIAVTYNYRQELGELLGIIEAQTAAQKVQEKVTKQYTENFGKGVAETKASIEQLIYVIKSEYSSLQQREQAYKKLISIDSSFIGTLDNQFRATNKLNIAFNTLIQNLQKYAMAQAEVAVRAEAFKKYAETEMQLGINKVKMQDAEDAIDKVAKKLNEGKITIKDYAEATKKIGWRDLKSENIELTKILKEQRAEKEIISRIDKDQIKDLQKGNAIIRAQLSGGKIQGKAMTEQDRKYLNSQLLNNENILKLRFGIEPELKVEPAAVKGWVEKIDEQIAILQEKQKKAPTKKLYLQYEAEIKVLEDQKKIDKAKKDNKQIAEIFPLDSIKELQRRSSLIQEAYDTAVNGMVKLRRLDKYGRDKDKNGNPFLTGEIISTEEAGKRLDELNEQIKNKQYRNFQERIDESERQWNNYYKMAEFYGKETADAQYKDLFKGSQSYLSYLEAQEQALKDLGQKGILSDKQKQDLVFLQGKIRELDGTETPLENFKRGIDNALKSMPSLADQLDYINKISNAEFLKGNKKQEYLQKRPVLNEIKSNILQQQKDIYQEFLTEQTSFEQKKLNIEQKYNDIRKKIGEDQTISDTERLKRLGQATKKEGEEIGSASLESFKKTDLWVKAFGDLDRIGPKTLARLKKGLEDYLKTSEGKGLPATETKDIQDQIKRLNDLVNTNNPYKAIGIAVDIYREKRRKLNEEERKSGRESDKYREKLEDSEQAFRNIIELAGAAAKATIDTVGNIIEAFGGMSDELKQTFAEIQQLVDGIVNVIAGYFGPNKGQMITGLVQIVGAMAKILNGDKAKEKDIRSWSVAVEDLKTQYQELQYQIEKTAGPDSLKGQRKLIENLEEQKRLVIQMREEEAKKKKADKDKIASYDSQISQLNQQISSVIDNFRNEVLGTDFKELSQKLADALVQAFGQGENAAKSFDKVWDDVMRNAVENALRLKILEPAVKDIVDQLYSSMGFGNGTTNSVQSLITDQEKKLADLDAKIKWIEENEKANAPGVKDEVLALKEQRQKLLQTITNLKAQITANPIGGEFDGLTQAERDAIKSMGQTAMQQYMDALKQYEELFGQSAENAQGLKGDIKGLTEKTGGAIESQFNAMRINIGEVLKLMQGNKILDNAKINLLSQIEVNTRNLVQIRKDMQELNSKVKYGAAGIP